MRDNLLSDIEAKEIVETEGLDYAVQHYVHSDRFASPELRVLWQTAADALDDLQEYLDAVDESEEDRDDE